MELKLPKKLMLTKQMHKKIVITVTIKLLTVVLSNIAILNIKSSDYHWIITLISKNDPINLMPYADLTEKAKHFKA